MICINWKVLNFADNCVDRLLFENIRNIFFCFLNTTTNTHTLKLTAIMSTNMSIDKLTYIYIHTYCKTSPCPRPPNSSSTTTSSPVKENKEEVKQLTWKLKHTQIKLTPNWSKHSKKPKNKTKQIHMYSLYTHCICNQYIDIHIHMYTRTYESVCV